MFFRRKKGSTKNGSTSLILVMIALYLLYPKISSYISGNVDIGNAQNYISKRNLINIFDSAIDSAFSSNDNNKDEEFSNLDYDIDNAKDMLSKIRIEDPVFDIDNDGKSDYNRKSFERPEKKFKSKYSGKSIGIRNYVLEETLGMSYDDANLSYICPYTGDVISNARNIDYDHIVPLAYAFSHGGSNWTDEEKNNYAFDTSVGICTSSSSNRAKGAKGPAEWMPNINRKWYAYKWLDICTRYNISITKEDYDVIVNTLGL